MAVNVCIYIIILYIQNTQETIELISAKKYYKITFTVFILHQIMENSINESMDKYLYQ